MAYVAGSLADGFVATTQGVLYTSTGKAVIRTLFFYNVNAATQTLNIYIKRSGGTARQTHRLSLAQYATQSITDPIVLSSGDTLEADTTTTSAVSYFIGGAVG